MDELVRKLGTEKMSTFLNDFDLIVDKYRKIADISGYKNELRFKKEHGKMVIFVQINSN
jgi:hypothetical protein